MTVGKARFLRQDLITNISWASTKSASSSVYTLQTIPIELLERIFHYADIATLFKLFQVCRLFCAIVQPRILSYVKQITVRLWVFQPYVVAHKPLDFKWTCWGKNGKQIFEASEPITSATSFLSTSASCLPQIDGCTLLVRKTRQIYSMSYAKTVHLPICDVGPWQRVSHKIAKPSCNDDIAFGRQWDLWYDIDEVDHQEKRLNPRQFECDIELFDPDIMESACAQTLPRQGQELHEDYATDSSLLGQVVAAVASFMRNQDRKFCFT
ncbi:hypothetical protein DFQ30_002507 [Apophysomyces sp. BC1015]|nr:hypothetical protein DFQ30_002507 [Apophysomyces sp. BC1015]